MHLEAFREYCLGKIGVTEELPFGPDTLVYKVMGKMFALCGFDDVPGSCNLKCDPDRAIELREKYSSVIPGYHMNKKYWNTVVWDGNVPEQLLLQLIDHSYELVVAGLPQNLKMKLKGDARKASSKRKRKAVSKK